MVRVSIIIPTLNEEGCIERCLKTLSNQTVLRKDYEIIVSDGGSKDKTVKIARKYADRVVVVKKRGISVGLNAGIRKARSDVIAVTHADCLVPDFWVERILSDMKDCDALYGPALYDTKKEPHLILYINNMASLSTFNVGRLLGRMFTDSRNVAYRKRVFETVGVFREMTPADDILFNLDLKGVRIKYDPSLLVRTSGRRELSRPFIKRNLENIYTVPLCRLGLIKNREYHSVR